MTGKEIRAARKARGLSVSRLAREAGVSYFVLYFWETGRCASPRAAEDRQKIVDALNRHNPLNLTLHVPPSLGGGGRSSPAAPPKS